MLRTIFFGSAPFAVPSLKVTAECSRILTVATQPDRPAGRGMRLQPTPVKAAAQAAGLPVAEPTDLRVFAREISGEQPDLFVLVAYGRILPRELLRVPRMGALNVHPSLLPRHRGATPIQSALLAGDEVTGVTLMLMDEGVDTGDVVMQERVPIAPDDDYGTLHDRLADLGAELLRRALVHAERGPLPHRPQEGVPTVTRPLRPEDTVVDWTQDASDVLRRIRAFAPRPAARAVFAGERVKLVRAHLAAGPHAPPGSFLGIEGDALLVACGRGTIGLDVVVPPNRGPMSGAAFARSRGIASATVARS